MTSSRGSSTSNAASPAARRPTSATWKDPRMAIGIALVALSVLLGAKLLGDADDTVSVWAAEADMAAGTPLTADKMVATEVRFANTADADRYIMAESALPVGTTVVRSVGAGELVPRAALGDADATTLVEVPLAAVAEAVPPTVRIGSVVDVWVTPSAQADNGPGSSVLIFDDVSVIAAPRSGSALGPSATRQLVIGFDPHRPDDLAEALSHAATGSVVITRQG